MIGRHCRIIGNEFKDILVLFVRPYSKTLALLESILITRYEVIFLQARTNTIREKNILTNVKTFWVYVRLSLFIMTIGPYCQIIEKKSKEVVGVFVQLIEKNFK